MPPEPSIGASWKEALSGFTVISLNAARALGNHDCMKALVDLLAEDVPNWAAIFISESDSSNADLSFSTDAHVHERHNPGKGSRPMRWIINSRFKSNIGSVKWLGRSGALTLGSVCLIGTHGGLGDGLAASLVDASTLVRQRDWGTVPVVLGDMNIDILPVQIFDPCAAAPGRREKHKEERGLLYALLAATGLNVSVPCACISAPSGKWRDQCFLAPISRVPPESSAALPSLLDFCCDRGGLVRSSWLSWSAAPGDHASLIIELGSPLTSRKWCKSHWNITDKIACAKFMATHLASAPDTWAKCLDAVRFAQNMFADHQPCRARSANRFPSEAKDLLLLAHSLQDDEAKLVRDQAWSLVRSRLKSIAISKLTEAISGGKPPYRASKMFKILSLSSNGNALNNSEEWGPVFQRHYADKWGARNLTARELIMDCCHSTSGLLLNISQEEVRRACASIKHRNRLDRDGVCVNAIALWNETCGEGAASIIAKLMASNTSSQAQIVHARVFGKLSAHTEVDETRVILPLGAIAQIADVLISCRLNSCIDRLLPPVSGTFIGARPKTQSAEIAVAAQLWAEKSLDCGSIGALVQEDVRWHFDTLSIPSIMQWLLKHDVEPALVGAALRAQMLPQIMIRCQAAECVISGRATGGLTGSRVAGSLARIPIEQTLATVARMAGSQGFAAGEVRLTLASYVDNIFVLGKDGPSAVLIADKFEELLASQWKQTIKPSSREIMVPKGARVGAVNLKRWKLVENMNVLGNTIQHNAETDLAWIDTERRAMGILFRRAHSGVTKYLSAISREKILNLTIKPYLLFRLTPSPLSEHRVYQVEKLQRRCYSTVSGISQQPEESKIVFHKRKHHELSIMMQRGGLWHRAVCKGHLSFRSHIERSAARGEWGGVLEQWQDTSVAAAMLAGRRLWRKFQGHVAQRWASAAAVATSHSNDEHARNAKLRTF